MIPRVSVIIVDHNSGDLLLRCIKHLTAQHYKDFETILVNNGSSSYTDTDFDQFGINISVLSPGENLGFAKGCNHGAKLATGEWLAFLNPDAYPDPEWLDCLVQATKRHPSVDAFGSTQIMASNPSHLDGAGDVYHILGIPYRGYFGWEKAILPEEGEVFAACGAAALYRAESFKNLGGFDERFFCYGEDVDLGFRLRITGGRTIQVPSAIVRHEGSAISGRHSEFTIYHGHRNRVWLAYKNTPFWLYWPFLPLHFAASFYLFFRLLIAGISKPYLKGIWHGYTGLARFRKDRTVILRGRKASYKSLIQAIEWSPLKLPRREGRNW